MQPTLIGSATPVTMGRPSLYSEPAMQGLPVGSGSILGGLESAHPRLKAHNLFIVALIVIALGVAIWTLTREGIHLRVPVDSTPPAISAENPPQVTTPTTVAAINATPPAPIVADAVAETTPVPGRQLENPPAEAQSLVAHEQSLSPREELVAAAATATAEHAQLQLLATASASGRNAAAGDKAGRVPVSEPQAGKNLPPAITTRPAPIVAAAQKAQASPSSRPAASATLAKTGEKDGDVELIAALLNRVSSKPDKADATIGDSLRKSVPAEGRKVTPSTPANKKTKKGAAIREVVIVKPVDTAQAQLERCTTLGFFEAEMCRLRACTGRWGSDPSCPEYAQNNNVAP